MGVVLSRKCDVNHVATYRSRILKKQVIKCVKTKKSVSLDSFLMFSTQFVGELLLLHTNMSQFAKSVEQLSSFPFKIGQTQVKQMTKQKLN